MPLRMVVLLLGCVVAACDQSPRSSSASSLIPSAPTAATSAVDDAARLVGTERQGSPADSIRIVSGELRVDPPRASLELKGTAGFRLSARLSVGAGYFGPDVQCAASPACVPGAEVTLDAAWSDTDFPGVAVLRGQTYDRLGSQDPRSASVTLRLEGSATLPPFEAGRSVAEVSAPFSATGELRFYPGSSTVEERESLTGGGTAHLTFERDPFTGAVWFFRSAVYVFEPTKNGASRDLR